MYGICGVLCGLYCFVLIQGLFVYPEMVSNSLGSRIALNSIGFSYCLLNGEITGVNHSSQCAFSFMCKIHLKCFQIIFLISAKENEKLRTKEIIIFS